MSLQLDGHGVEHAEPLHVLQLAGHPVDAPGGAAALGVLGAQRGQRPDRVGAAVEGDGARDHLERRGHRAVGTLNVGGIGNCSAQVGFVVARDTLIMINKGWSNKG